MNRKRDCNTCNKATTHLLNDIRITQCKECGAWNISDINYLTALKMKEQGFDWHRFTEQIEKLGKIGTAKDIFLSKIGGMKK